MPDLETALTTGVELKITGTLPGEALLTKLLEYAAAVRATMDPELMRRLDAVNIQQVEDLQKVWRSLWVALKVVKE